MVRPDRGISLTWPGARYLYFAFVKTRKDEKEIKQIQMKNEFKCSNISFMHNHTLHDTLHQIYVFLSKTGMQGEEGLALDKSFKKTFERKKVIQTNQSF